MPSSGNHIIGLHFIRASQRYPRTPPPPPPPHTPCLPPLTVVSLTPVSTVGRGHVGPILTFAQPNRRPRHFRSESARFATLTCAEGKQARFPTCHSVTTRNLPEPNPLVWRRPGDSPPPSSLVPKIIFDEQSGLKRCGPAGQE